MDIFEVSFFFTKFTYPTEAKTLHENPNPNLLSFDIQRTCQNVCAHYLSTKRKVCHTNMLLSLRKASSIEHGQLPYILSVADKSYCGALFFPSDFFMYLPVRTVDYD